LSSPRAIVGEQFLPSHRPYRGVRRACLHQSLRARSEVRRDRPPPDLDIGEGSHDFHAAGQVLHRADHATELSSRFDERATLPMSATEDNGEGREVELTEGVGSDALKEVSDWREGRQRREGSHGDQDNPNRQPSAITALSSGVVSTGANYRLRRRRLFTNHQLPHRYPPPSGDGRLQRKPGFVAFTQLFAQSEQNGSGAS